MPLGSSLAKSFSALAASRHLGICSENRLITLDTQSALSDQGASSPDAAARRSVRFERASYTGELPFGTDIWRENSATESKMVKTGSLELSLSLVGLTAVRLPAGSAFLSSRVFRSFPACQSSDFLKSCSDRSVPASGQPSSEDGWCCVPALLRRLRNYTLGPGSIGF